MKIYRFVLIWFLLGLFLTGEILPARSQAVSVNPDRAQKLLREARKDYDAENFTEAVKNLRQAADDFAFLGEELKEAIALGNLSLAYQQLGNWQEAQIAIGKSFHLLGFMPDSETPQNWQIPAFASEKLHILARLLSIYGRFWYARGKPENALSSWQLAANIYEKLDRQQEMIVNQLDRVQALQALGLYQEAKKTIEKTERNLDRLPKSLKVKALLSLGNVMLAVGELDNAQKFLQESLALAQSLNSPEEIGAAQLSLANTFRVWGNLERDRQLPSRSEYLPWRCQVKESLANLPEQAKKFYEEAEKRYQQVIEIEKRSPLSSTKIKAQLNLLRLLIETGKWSQAQSLSNTIQIFQLPTSRSKIYSQINLTKSLACLQQEFPQNSFSWEEIVKQMEITIDEANKLEDKRAQSYALGSLGGLSEYLARLAQKQENRAQQWSQTAQQLTQKALYLTQPSEIPDIAYQWQWQLGRLQEARGNRQEAIANYQAAIATLRSVRGDLLVINSEVQFSFRDNVEPVYRQLANLLLQQPTAENLAETRRVIQLLQVAEIENFLRCNLQDVQPVALDNLVNRERATEAVIYPIVLDKHVEIILKLPNTEKLRHYSTSVSRSEVEEVLERLQENLAKPQGKKRVQLDAQKVYQWLIAPLLTDLNNTDVNTLVFLLDTPLRNIPMAALYDGTSYLIEKYAVAITSGLELLEPKPLPKEQLNAILAGLTESRQGYHPLKNVDDQFRKISEQIASKVLLDREFTVSTFQNQINLFAFPIVHLATHGQFSSQPQETYIIAWDRRINVNDLSNLLKSRQENRAEPIELLVLAACQTARGDKRATLGLAGVAINAGARSTLATLWKVIADESPGELLSQFYRQLKENPNITKAEALRRAQLEFLKDDSRNRPYFWAPYVLVGNWL
jgi:CHAT domain-containing protein/tetratricopeptide (TPR) repeat protein